MRVISVIKLLLAFGIIVLMFKLEAWAFVPRVPASIMSSVGKQFSHDKSGDRIIGGRLALSGEFPYQASIQKISILGTKTHYCGGALVGNCVVTAAHCLLGRSANDLVVRLGSITLKSDSLAQEYRVDKVTVHPTYDSKSIVNDIGILKLAKKVELGVNVKPVSLPVFKSEVAADKHCIVSGWGSQKEGGSVSKALMYASVPTMTDATCRGFYGKSEIYEAMFCAGYLEGGIDSCQGCARPRFPGVYTQVSYYKKWIESHDCLKPPNVTQASVPAKFFSFQLFPFWTV